MFSFDLREMYFVMILISAMSKPVKIIANKVKVTITEDLRHEGIARELVNRIQNIRKSSGFEITDKIKITLSKNPHTDDAVKEYKDYICKQVLANSLELAEQVENAIVLDLDDMTLQVNVTKE